MVAFGEMKYCDMGADISPCGQFRYSLWREWNGGDGTVVFIGLNPSTADAAVDDPTARRCVDFAQSWKFCRLVMVNLFAYRSPDPASLRQAIDPVGPDNDRQILQQCQDCSQTVVAWGNNGSLQNRQRAVSQMLAESEINLFCLGTTKRGQPRHPLYVHHSTLPIPYVS